VKAASPLILALDVPTQDLALHWVRQVRDEISVFKIGMQLFYRFGPEIVRAIQDEGGEIFLDLKLHDIPNTVARACESLLDLNVKFVTVHISGGMTMLREAQSVVAGSNTKLLGITALTSIDQETLNRICPDMPFNPSNWALHLANVAQDAGIFGVVCSAQENRFIRERLGDTLCLVNPGIRPAGADVQDQKRVVTPKAAMESGANYLVIGRPILQAEDPKVVVRQIQEEMSYAARLSS
jgi:orotidine-5'-phosphate decarboxylase